mmetsp:Transcript_45276/g.141940  ORF Transcript_45276/g.141940 Transcript_45276/m.141940 type:complete len:204 (+) Transcript_45276:1717-2328(+)
MPAAAAAPHRGEATPPTTCGLEDGADGAVAPPEEGRLAVAVEPPQPQVVLGVAAVERLGRRRVAEAVGLDAPALQREPLPELLLLCERAPAATHARAHRERLGVGTEAEDLVVRVHREVVRRRAPRWAPGAAGAPAPGHDGRAVLRRRAPARVPHFGSGSGRRGLWRWRFSPPWPPGSAAARAQGWRRRRGDRVGVRVRVRAY